MKVCELCAVDFTLRHFLLPLAEAIRDAGHEVTCVSAEGPGVSVARDRNLRVVTVPISRRMWDLAAHVRTYRAYRALFAVEAFDLVHVHTPVAAFLARLAAARAGVPRIAYTAHGFYFHDRMPAWKRRAFIALERLAGRATHILLTQSAEDAEAARFHRLARPGAAIVAIGNGVDPGRFAPPPDRLAIRGRLRAALETPADAPVIVMVGRLVAEKGYLDLFAARRRVDAVLWAVGERLPSDHAARIDRAIAAIAADPILKERVRLLGYRADMPEILHAADIFVLPSHREGMPRSIIEAMMTGLPVVATDIRGSREEVVDGETGILVPVGDKAALAAALSRLATDPALRAAMGGAGQARARALYDEKAVIARQLDLLGLA